MKNPMVAAALPLVLAAAGCGAGEVDNEAVVAHARAHEQFYAQAYEQFHRPLSVDPCSLLTKDEIAAQVELTPGASAREAYRQKGIRHEISSEENPGGAWRACRISWRSVAPSGEQFHSGEFTVHVMSREQLKRLAGDAPMRKPITGVGDEAFEFENAPYARVGNVAVGITEYADTEAAEGGLDLLRVAVQRLR